jgi:16S rRNA (uracil1498-N3)-methyltransferase
MRIHRFLIDQPLTETVSITEESLVHQWTHVLRMQEGGEVNLCDGKGVEARYKIAHLSKKSVECLRLSESVVSPRPSREITLYLSLIKHEHVDLVVEKAVELGVRVIVPITTQRTIKQKINQERLRRIMREATEQSGQRWLPILQEIRSIDTVLKEDQSSSRWFCDMHGKKVSEAKSASSQNVAICIGPEGGWTTEERNTAEKHGWQIVELSQTILRAETAAIVACFAAQQ